MQAAAAPPSAEILALTPEVVWQCQRTGRSYLKIDQFYSELDLAAAHRAFAPEVISWLRDADELAHDCCPVLRGTRFRPALAHSFLLQNLFDEIFFGMHALRGLLRATAGPILTPRAWNGKVPLHLQLPCGVLALLLPGVAPERWIAWDVASARNARPARQTLRDRARTMLPSGGLGEIRQIKRFGLRDYLRTSLRRGYGRPVLMTEGGYDLAPLTRELRERGIDVEWITKLTLVDEIAPDMAGPFERSWNHMAANPEFWRPAEILGAGRPAFLETILHKWWSVVAPQHWSAYMRASERFSRKRYQAVVSWEAGGGTLASSVLQAANAAGVPRFLYQHGSTARTSGTWWHSWLAHADCLLAYGPGTVERLQNSMPPGTESPRLVAVGSARLDHLAATMTPSRRQHIRRQLSRPGADRVAIYVPTYFGGWGRNTSDAAGYPDASYFETQLRVLGLFRDYPRTGLIYKELKTVNSARNPVTEFLAREVPWARGLTNGLSLAEAFFGADLIIVDHVITALGEALLSDAPIVVFDPGEPETGIPESPAARQLLRRRARVATTPDGFVEAVREALAGKPSPDVSIGDRAFLAHYVTSGGSAQKAADAVLGWPAAVLRERMPA